MGPKSRATGGRGCQEAWVPFEVGEQSFGGQGPAPSVRVSPSRLPDPGRAPKRRAARLGRGGDGSGAPGAGPGGSAASRGRPGTGRRGAAVLPRTPPGGRPQDFPPPPPGISAPPAGAAGLARVDSAPGPGITARSAPMYIFPRPRRRGRDGMAAAGGAASPGGPARPCAFSIEHILSGLPERSPAARAARPPQPAGRQGPAQPGAPTATPCECCCGGGPRAAPRGPPEPAPGLGECARARAGVLRAAPSGQGSAAGPRLTAPSPCRRAAAVAAEARARGAPAPGRPDRGFRGAGRRGRPGPAAAHAAPPHHLQRGAAAGAGGALRAEPVPRRGHARAPGRPHPPARGARGGGCGRREGEGGREAGPGTRRAPRGGPRRRGRGTQGQFWGERRAGQARAVKCRWNRRGHKVALNFCSPDYKWGAHPCSRIWEAQKSTELQTGRPGRRQAGVGVGRGAEGLPVRVGVRSLPAAQAAFPACLG